MPRIQYYAVHDWIHKNYSKTGTCEQCGKLGKTEWSNKSGHYLQEREDWQEFCVKCHRQYDRQPHMRRASFKVGAPSLANVWQIRDMDEETYKKLWNYKVEHGLKTLAQALKQIVDYPDWIYKKAAVKIKHGRFITNISIEDIEHEGQWYHKRLWKPIEAEIELHMEAMRRGMILMKQAQLDEYFKASEQKGMA